MAISSPNVQKSNKPSGAQMFLDTMKTVNSMFQQKQQLDQYQRALDLQQRQQTAQSLWDGIKALAPDYGGLGPLAVKNPQIFASAFAAIGMPEGTIHQVMSSLKQVQNLRPDLQGQMGLEQGIEGWFDAATRLSEAPSLEAGQTALTGYLGNWAKTLDGQIQGITSLAGGVSGGTVGPVVNPNDGVVDEEVPEIPAPAGGEISTGDEGEGEGGTSTPPPYKPPHILSSDIQLEQNQIALKDSIDAALKAYSRNLSALPSRESVENGTAGISVEQYEQQLAPLQRRLELIQNDIQKLEGATKSAYVPPEGMQLPEGLGTPAAPAGSTRTTPPAVAPLAPPTEEELQEQVETGNRGVMLGSPAYQELAAQLRGRVATAGQTDASNNWAQVGQTTKGSRYQPTTPGVTPVTPGQEEFGLEQASRARGNAGVQSVLAQKTKDIVSRGTPIAELSPEQVETLLGPPVKSADGNLQSSLNIEILDQLPISRDAKTYITDHTPETAALLRTQATLQREASGMQPETEETRRAQFARGQEARTQVVQDVRQAVKKGKESPVVLRTMEFGKRVVDKLEQTGQNFIRAFESLPRAQQEAASEVINWGVREYAEDYRGALEEQAKFLKDAPREVLAQFLPGVEESTVRRYMMDLEAGKLELSRNQLEAQTAMNIATILMQATAMKLAMMPSSSGGKLVLSPADEKFMTHYLDFEQQMVKEYGKKLDAAELEKLVQDSNLQGVKTGHQVVMNFAQGLYGAKSVDAEARQNFLAALIPALRVGYTDLSWDSVNLLDDFRNTGE